MDITELLRGAELTQTGWSRKEAEIQEDFIWGIGPEALYQMTRAEYKTEPDKIAVEDIIRLLNEYFSPKPNTYHNGGEFFWTKQTGSGTPEDFWRRLKEIEKECAFEGITAEDLLISKFLTAITDTKLRDKLMKEKKLELKKTIEMIKQNTYERKNRKNTITEAYRKIFEKLSNKWGLTFNDDRIIEPNELRQKLLETIHFGHAGSTKMAAESKIFWWPNMQKEIEEKAKTVWHAWHPVRI